MPANCDYAASHMVCDAVEPRRAFARGSTALNARLRAIAPTLVD
jgi:hypothetical protein